MTGSCPAVRYHGQVDTPTSSAAQFEGDVALLVDWENLKFSLAQRERRPNVTALREAVERFGRVVYARAYADWQDPVHAGDPASLYLAGLEPVYVLTRRYTDASGEVRIKNSVDVKLAADCIEASHTLPSVRTYVIVSGDHGFLHVVNTLRPHGKKVVVIGVSWTTSAQLTDQADVVLYYDVDVEPARREPLAAVTEPAVAAAAAPTRKVAPQLAAAAERAIQLIRAQGASTPPDARAVAEALELVLAITREYRAERREFSVSLLGQELQKRMTPVDFQRVAKGRARAFAQALDEAGQVRIVPRDFVDWIFLPSESRELIDAIAPTPALAEAPRYDYTGFVYSDLSPDDRDRVIRSIYDQRHSPGIDWLTFKRVSEAVAAIVRRDDLSVKNLVNNMLATSVLRFDAEKDGRDPETGALYRYRTVALDLQHPDVRRALNLG